MQRNPKGLNYSWFESKRCLSKCIPKLKICYLDGGVCKCTHVTSIRVDVGWHCRHIFLAISLFFTPTNNLVAVRQTAKVTSWKRGATLLFTGLGNNTAARCLTHRAPRGKGERWEGRRQQQQQKKNLNSKSVRTWEESEAFSREHQCRHYFLAFVCRIKTFSDRSFFYSTSIFDC